MLSAQVFIEKNRSRTPYPSSEEDVSDDFLDFVQDEVGLGNGGVRSPGNEVIEDDEPDARLKVVLSEGAAEVDGICSPP